MTKKRIAINGFGRIGRLTTRILLEKYSDQCELVAINDLTTNANLAYLFKYDSTFGQPSFDVQANEAGIMINGKIVPVYAEKNPLNIPWSNHDIDVVIECTGFFRDEEAAKKHLQAGAKQVLISAPAKSETIPTIVVGVSEVPKGLPIYSNASCTTNCLAPVAKVLQDSFGIVRGSGVTVHAYTSTQRLQDSPSDKDFRKGRAASNIIPTSTGAAKAVEKVIPEIQGKIELSALRVPIMSGSIIQLVVELEDEEATKESVRKSLEEYSQKHPSILQLTSDPLVSSDIVGNSHSAIIDVNLLKYTNNLLTIVMWYDNEWGYSNRLADLALQI